MALNTIDEIMKRGALKNFVDNGGEEDMAILSDPPCVVEIAGRKLKVRALTLENHKRWLMIFGTIVRQYEIALESVEWPETKLPSEAQRQKWQAFFSSSKIQEQALAMVEQTLFREPGNRWWRWHTRWFRRHVTIMDLMDLFFYLYLWNCEAPKKNSTFLLRRIGFVRQKATLLGGWSQNLAGHSGAQVTPRYPGAPPASDGSSVSGQSETPLYGSSSSSGSVQPSRPIKIKLRAPVNPAAPPLPRVVRGAAGR